MERPPPPPPPGPSVFRRASTMNNHPASGIKRAYSLKLKPKTSGRFEHDQLPDQHGSDYATESLLMDQFDRPRPYSFNTGQTSASDRYSTGGVSFLDILSSRHETSEDGDAIETRLNVRVPQKNDKSSVNIDSQERSSSVKWVHLHQANAMDLESFRRVTLQQPNLTDDDKLVLHQLFNKVRRSEISTIDPRYFRYMQPGVIEMHGSYDNSHGGYGASVSNEVNQAKFLCFPYFSFQKLVPVNKLLIDSSLNYNVLHPIRTLLQSQYDMESTERQDQEKARKQQRQMQDPRVVHVAQFWVIILGEKLLLTCANLTLSQLLGSTITLDYEATVGKVGCLVKLTNGHTNKSYSITLSPDKTWLEFLYRVQLLRTAGVLSYDSLAELLITSPNGTHVTESEWAALIGPVQEIELTFLYAYTQPTAPAGYGPGNAQSAFSGIRDVYGNPYSVNVPDPKSSSTSQPQSPNIRPAAGYGHVHVPNPSAQSAPATNSRSGPGPSNADQYPNLSNPPRSPSPDSDPSSYRPTPPRDYHTNIRSPPASKLATSGRGSDDTNNANKSPPNFNPRAEHSARADNEPLQMPDIPELSSEVPSASTQPYGYPSSTSSRPYALYPATGTAVGSTSVPKPPGSIIHADRGPSTSSTYQSPAEVFYTPGSEALTKLESQAQPAGIGSGTTSTSIAAPPKPILEPYAYRPPGSHRGPYSVVPALPGAVTTPATSAGYGHYNPMTNINMPQPSSYNGYEYPSAPAPYALPPTSTSTYNTPLYKPYGSSSQAQPPPQVASSHTHAYADQSEQYNSLSQPYPPQHSVLESSYYDNPYLPKPSSGPPQPATSVSYWTPAPPPPPLPPHRVPRPYALSGAAIPGSQSVYSSAYSTSTLPPPRPLPPHLASASYYTPPSTGLSLSQPPPTTSAEVQSMPMNVDVNVPPVFMWPTERSSGVDLEPYNAKSNGDNITASTTQNRASPQRNNKGKDTAARAATPSSTTKFENYETAATILDDIGRSMKQDQDSAVAKLYDGLLLSNFDKITKRLEHEIYKDPEPARSELQKRILDLAKEVLEFFIPLDIYSEVPLRFWGAVERIIKDIDNQNKQSYWADQGRDAVLGYHHSLQTEELLSTVAQKARQIRRGVLSHNQHHPSYYCVPVALVQAFRWLLKALTLFGGVGDNLTAATNAAQKCDENMQEGVYQLLTMLRLGDYSHGAVFECIKPQALVGLILINLSMGTSNPITPTSANEEQFDILRYYLRHVNKIQLQLQKRPRRHLLGDAHSISQELGMVQTILSQEYQCLGSAVDGSPPDDNYSYDHCKEIISGKMRWLSQLQENVRDTSVQILQLLDVNKDSNDKAIFAFTTVTVIFLPLSFVTSYMGMNTADIRDMSKGQGLFWGAALPVTIITLVLTFFIAFKWERLVDMTEEYSDRFRRGNNSESDDNANQMF